MGGSEAGLVAEAAVWASESALALGAGLALAWKAALEWLWEWALACPRAAADRAAVKASWWETQAAMMATASAAARSSEGSAAAWPMPSEWSTATAGELMWQMRSGRSWCEESVPASTLGGLAARPDLRLG